MPTRQTTSRTALTTTTLKSEYAGSWYTRILPRSVLHQRGINVIEITRIMQATVTALPSHTHPQIKCLPLDAMERICSVSHKISSASCRMNIKSSETDAKADESSAASHKITACSCSPAKSPCIAVGATTELLQLQNKRPW